MLRKIIGFLPAVFWLLLTVIGCNGFDPYGPQSIPWNLVVLFLLAIASGVLLLFNRCIAVGCAVGMLPGLYIFLFMEAATATDRLIPMILVLFYIVYAIFYFVYRREAGKK